jgi:hypothetical protein
MEKFKADKTEFMATVVPGWIEKAKANGKLSDPDLLNQYNGYQYADPDNAPRVHPKNEPVVQGLDGVFKK